MSKITIYEADIRQKIGWIKTWKILFNNIFTSKELIWQLFKRDFLMANKKSFLGMSWLIFSPIMGIISWIFMNSTGVLQPGKIDIPYPVYVLISSTVFGLFGGFFGAASGTLNAGAGFITQVNYPHDVLLIKQALGQFANFGITFMVNIIVTLFFGVIPSWMTILVPIIVFPIFLLASSIGLVACILGVVATDLNRVLTFFVGLLLYLTPVIYSPKVANPLLQNIIRWNPLTYLVGGARDAIIYGKIDKFDYFLYASLLSLLLFLFSWRVFYLVEQKVIEKML